MPAASPGRRTALAAVLAVVVLAVVVLAVVVAATPSVAARPALAATPALTAAGELDGTFGPNGKVVTGIGDIGQDTGNGVAVQPDGKVVVAGASSTATTTDEPHDIAVIRYLEDGTRDPGFATHGIYSHDLSGQDFAYDVAIAPSGKIVVVGTALMGGNSAVVVLRLTAAGAPDPSFGGGDGVVETQLTTQTDKARAVAVQPDGRILVAGESGSTGGSGNAFVARYTTGGVLDGSFSGDGVLTLDVLGRGAVDAARDLVLQGDGAVVITGNANDGTRDLAFVARTTAVGTLDPSFSGDGKRTISFGPAGSVGRGIALTPGRQIVVVGSYDVGSAGTMVAAQLRRGGPLDKSFSGDGKRAISFGAGHEVGYSALVQGDGAIVAGGYALAPAGTDDFAVARLTPTGGFDLTFGGDGRVLTDFSGRQDFCYALALGPDGRIVGTGGTRFGDALTLEDVGTARWLAA